MLFVNGYSLVTYADPAIAEAAIEQFNNVELGGRPIHIRLDRKEVEASGGFPGEYFGKTNVYCSGADNIDVGRSWLH